jgi:hypothetical protein
MNGETFPGVYFLRIGSAWGFATRGPNKGANGGGVIGLSESGRTV